MFGLVCQSRLACRHLLLPRLQSLSTLGLPPSHHQDKDDPKEPHSFYEPHFEQEAKTSEEIKLFRDRNRISIKGVDTNPIFSFRESGLPQGIIEKLSCHGFDKPTPIQAQGWPIAMNGDNVIAIGETGSGKTLGFVLPAICHIMRQPRRRSRAEGPVVLILAPTRELAQQINTVVRHFASRIPSACLVGGTHKHVQIRDLDRGADFVVATPGRLIDLIEDGATDLERVSYVVLDEADRMLDMGFEPQIQKIMQKIKPDRQLLMWSATWPTEVESLAQDFFGGSNYAHVNIGSSELQANKLIEQNFKFCNRNLKRDILKDIMDSLTEVEKKKVLVFAATKSRVDILVRNMRNWNLNANGIHGDKTQAKRTQVLNDFRSGRIDVLVATDVASRGLDVSDIQVVINYDFPNDVESYVHRIGRTGRNNKSGRSFSFFEEENDAFKAKDLISILEEADQPIPTELRQISQSRKFKRQPKYRQKKVSFDDDFYNSPWRRSKNRERRYSEDIL